MNRPFRLFLRAVGIARPEPTSPFQRSVRRVERLLLVLTLVYAVLQVFPQVLFAHTITERGITLHARRAIPPQAAEWIAKARDLVDRSELAAPSRNERIFLCDSPWLFRLFAPLSPGAFAVSIPLTNHVFVAAADLKSDTAYSRATDHASRPFSGVVAHEVSHGLIRRRLGFWGAWWLPTWITEGYCDYVAGGGSFPDAEGNRLLAAGQSHPSPSFRYFADRQMVTYLIEDQHMTFEAMTRQGSAEAAVRAAVRRRSARSTGALAR